MKLSQLIKGLHLKSFGHSSGADPDIQSVHYDSREVLPNSLFVAIPGFKVDGHNFIEDAVARGAVAVATEQPVNTSVEVVQIASARESLPIIASRFFNHPSRKLQVVGITGTNGKTTTAYLIESIFQQAGFNTGVIGTINYRFAGRNYENPVTTPESLDLQKILDRMVQDGVTHAIMEVSSHAVDLFRIKACQFNVGVFTNFSQDHLDYHKNMNAYWACKKAFFTDYLGTGFSQDQATAILNINDSKGRELAAALPYQCVTVGHQPDAALQPQDIQQGPHGIRGRLTTSVEAVTFASTLSGAHNLENILCAAGVGTAYGLAPETIAKGIANLDRVPGRLEKIPDPGGRFIYVDYAHTPDALKNVLQALRAMSSKRIVCVFGCGGDRDPDKRPQMGAVAAKLCDLAIITSDNPRTEKPLGIISQIKQGLQAQNTYEYQAAELIHGFKRSGYTVEPDRRRAIHLAIDVAEAGDTVLIAGKGHETYQILGLRTIAFDDRQEVRKALMAKKQESMRPLPDVSSGGS